MTPQQQAAQEGIDLDAATERVQGILKGKGIQPFVLPEVPAAQQTAGDQAFAESAKRPVNAAGEPHVWVGVGKKPRSDKGKPRPKPQPAPEPEQKAGRITSDQASEIIAAHLQVMAYKLQLEKAEEYFRSLLGLS